MKISDNLFTTSQEIISKCLTNRNSIKEMEVISPYLIVSPPNPKVMVCQQA